MKKHVLPVLESQRLIHIKPVRSDPTMSPKQAVYMWHLSPSLSDLPPGTTWDVDSHWDRLIKGEHPSQLHTELTDVIAGRTAAKKEALYERKVLRRPEREIWEMGEGREMELTTRLERVHLNKRRRNARPGKERKRLEGWKMLDEVAEEAKRELEMEKGEARDA